MRDRYTITDRVDAGGMAEVFRGVAESIQGFKKSVAIKRILPSLVKNEKFVNMFLDEAKVSLFLQHANIVQVFDIGKTDASYFLVMEFVDGCNMKALLDHLKEKGKRIELAHAIYVMLECCKALNYAHQAENPETMKSLEIVHRDVSPPNILVSKMGEVKLVDFGLAKANSQIASTDQGVVKGKFSYLSPEAASGLAVDRRADIFAVGILLWEMFTGRRLFYGDTDYQTVELVRQARIPSIAALNPDVAPELEAIVRKALAQDPNDRYQEAADLGDALAQYLFSNKMKVTARDIAAVVRETQLESARKRSVGPQNELINVLIRDEMAKVTSLVEGDAAPTGGEGAGSASLDPSSFVNTSDWESDFGIESGPVSAPPPEALPADSPAIPPPTVTPPPSTAEVESLQQMLEPDRTGVHQRSSASSSVKIAIFLLIVLAAGLGASLLLFKDKLFG
ncbi:MAG: serine/threonine protein kinase [Myxococcales bacterium]|nr:serine/threonine protein kinase [Myxococcales bacterium]